MNLPRRPKLHLPLALLNPATGPAPLPLRYAPSELRRMVAAMID